jgi:hypothetical protein
MTAETYRSRARPGEGSAAATVTLGAALGVFLFPQLIDDLGASAVLLIMAGCCAVGFLVTFAFRIETRGRTLSDISGAELGALSARPTPP